jgi:Tol biopolymer transport system component/tRNA A-37 threonylcarbamoyl transferase component Bud32
VSDRWQRVSELYQAALVRDVALRDAFLQGACAGDVELLREVESLLLVDDDGPRLPEAPQVHAGAPERLAVAESLVGRQIASYTIVSLIDGGTGVYRARDSKSGRDVAIKVLPAELTRDPERCARAEREARVLAVLAHPNIAAIYGIEEADGNRTLVLELIEGETLAEVIARGPLGLKQALTVARQIAAALAAAHDKGIFHRDLTPGSIRITSDGLVKVFDFGLSKASDAKVVTESVDPVGRSVTGMGFGTTVTMGAPGDMSPRHTQGQSADKRGDIRAFGCVLYEMLTARPAIEGDRVTDVPFAVSDREPDWDALPRSVPRSIRDLLRRCLTRDPSNHQADIDDAVAVIDRTLHRFSPKLRGRSRRSLRRRHLLAAVPALAALIVLAVWIGTMRAPRGGSELLPVPLTGLSGIEQQPTFSPDGSRVAFSWNGEREDNFDVYVKSIGREDPVRLTTDAATDAYPAWSPDGKWIAYGRANPASSGPRWFTYVVPSSGGAERLITAGMVQSWSADAGSLLVSRAAAAGEPGGLALISRETGDQRHLMPPTLGDFGSLAPDGSAIALWRDLGATAIAGILVQPLTAGLQPAGDPRELPVDGRIRFGPDSRPGWTADSREIIYAAGWNLGDSYLWRVAADGASPPRRLSYAGRGAYAPALSRDGRRLAYSRFLGETHIWSLPLDASGHAAGPAVVAFNFSKSESCPVFSPDGVQVAFQSNRSGSSEIWVCPTDVARCAPLTAFNGPHVGSPAWSPDGKWIAFEASGREGSEIHVVRAVGGNPRLVAWGVAPRWSRDGSSILYTNATGDGAGLELYRVPPTGGESEPVKGAAGGWLAQQTGDGSIYYSENPDAASTRVRKLRHAGAGSVEILSNVAGRNFEVTESGIWYFAAGQPNQPNALYFYDFASKASREVYRSERSVGPGISVSADGRRLLFTQVDRWGSDLMLIDGFR